MRNRALHAALRDFALEAAALLTDELRDGAEIEFDVVDEGDQRGPALYRYRPRTAEFVAARWEGLRALEACQRAAAELGAGAALWLRVNGLAGEQAEPALRAMLERLYEDATSFGYPRGALRAALRRGRADALPRRGAHARGGAAARRGAGGRVGRARRRAVADARRSRRAAAGGGAGGRQRAAADGLRARARHDAVRAAARGRRGGALQPAGDGDAPVQAGRGEPRPRRLVACRRRTLDRGRAGRRWDGARRGVAAGAGRRGRAARPGRVVRGGAGATASRAGRWRASRWAARA